MTQGAYEQVEDTKLEIVDNSCKNKGTEYPHLNMAHRKHEVTNDAQPRHREDLLGSTLPTTRHPNQNHSYLGDCRNIPQDAGELVE